MWPAEYPKPKFKVGDQVRHSTLKAVGTVTVVQPTPWLPNSPFSYAATWEPKVVETKAGQLDMDATRHPEGLLEAA